MLPSGYAMLRKGMYGQSSTEVRWNAGLLEVQLDGWIDGWTDGRAVG